MVQASQPETDSITDLTRCNHRTPPIPNCPRCLIPELLEALEHSQAELHRFRAQVFAGHQYTTPFTRCRVLDCMKARALIDKAKLIVDVPGDDDTIPAEDAPEAAAGDRHRWG